jgi:galactoside O-acetyltransferase
LLKKKIKLVILSLIEWMIVDIPGGLGRKTRYAYYKRRLGYIGENVIFDCGVKILNPEYVRIDSNTWIDNYTVILAGPPDSSRGAFNYKSRPGCKAALGEVIIGKNCHVAMFVVLQGHGGLEIGDNCGIASGSNVYSMSHHYRNIADPNDKTLYKFSPMCPPEEQSLIVSSVSIGNNCAVGLNSVLLPGTQLGEGAWLASGSVVSGAIAANTVAGGSPAKSIKEIER